MAHWWEKHPWRMVQTNLREIDMRDIDAKAYARQLKEFGATVVNLNAAGIVASYDTALCDHPKSQYLTGSSLKEIVEECHKQGIRVIARTDFSRIQYEVYERHPDWAARTVNGDIVNFNGYVNTCVNGGYQQEYMYEILKELFTTHPFDGLFCNMSGGYLSDYSGKFYGTCYCENCKNKYREEYGEEMPKISDPRKLFGSKNMAFLEKSVSEHKTKLHKFLRELNPELAINGLDFVRGESNTDYGRSGWHYTASTNSRVAAGPDRRIPSDNASVDFLGFRHRHISVSPELMELRQWQNFANSGCVSLYIMGTLENHRDTSGIKASKKVFDFAAIHEELFTGMKSAAPAAILRFGSWKRSSEEIMGWIRVLTESHIPFDEILLTDLQDLEQLSGKQLLILPDIPKILDAQAGIIDNFVKQGGTLIATGVSALADGENPALRCLGIRRVKEHRKNLMSSMFEIRNMERADFPRCADTPYIAPGSEILLVESEETARTYLRLIPEHPYGPPECCYYTEVSEEPGLICNSYANGRGILIPWKAGTLFRKEGHLNTFTFLQDVLFELAGIQCMAPDLSPMVELSVVQKPGYYVLQLINGSGAFVNSYYPPLPIRNIRLHVDNLRPKRVYTLNGGTVEWICENGKIVLTLDQLDHFEAIAIEI